MTRTREWRRLLREVPKLGWQERMAHALEDACDEIDRLHNGWTADLRARGFTDDEIATAIDKDAQS